MTRRNRLRPERNPAHAAIVANKPMTFAEIGAKLGMSKYEVARHFESGMAKVKVKLIEWMDGRKSERSSDER
jgi:DNA-binding transcriptional regulator GbsR (MarR family)